MTVKNSTIGRGGISMGWGDGKVLVENTTVVAESSYNRFISLSTDFGSSCQGEIEIKNCMLVVPAGRTYFDLITGANDGTWDFGYQCYLPSKVIIDNLTIMAPNFSTNANAVRIFAPFTEAANPAFPIIYPKEVYIRNLTRSIGTGFIVSNNTQGKFDGVKIIQQ